MKKFRAFAFLMMMQTVCPLPLMAQSVSLTGAPTAANTSSPTQTHSAVKGPMSLDLTSTSATQIPNHLPSSGTVNINVGGQTMQVNNTTPLTPAESLAVYQVMSTGQQSIALSALGNAIGGTFTIGPKFSQFVSNLVIPQGVTAIENVSNSSALNLSGNLTNAGSIFAVSTNPAVSTASISALNIVNQQGGLISSVLPAGGLPGVTGALSSLNLSLSAVNSILNSGTISSSGNLTLSAGNSITNALPAGVSGVSPLMQAAGNISLLTNQLNNAGLISSLTGNVNLAALNNNSINFNNSGGTVQALLGNINVRDALFNSKADFNLTGGNLLSKELNIFSGDGAVTVDTGVVTGMVNVNAGTASIVAQTPTLNVGAINLTGDPLIANASGDLIINTPYVTPGADYAFIAKGNVTTAIGATSIDTSSTTGNGGSVTIVAGANFAPPSGGITTITGGSSTGGKIDLTVGTALTGINTSSTFAGGNAGKVTLVAFAGSNTGSGTITLPSTMSITADSATGNAGDITMIAGGASSVPLSSSSSIPVSISGGTTPSGSGFTVNSIGNLHNVGLAGTGNISINVATPTVPSGGVLINNGTVGPQTFGVGAPVNGQIYASGITSSGNLNVAAGNSITFTGKTVVTGNATVTTTANNGGIFVNDNFVATGAVSMSANGSGTIITQNQVIAAPTVHRYPFGAALTPDGTFAFVPNNQSNNVSVIRTSDNTVVATIDLSAFMAGLGSGVLNPGPKGAVVSLDGASVYVVGRNLAGNGVVVVISTATQSVTTTYTFQAGNTLNAANFDPQLVATAPNGNVYVFSDYAANSKDPTVPNELTVINPASPGTPTSVTLTGGLGKAINLGGIAIDNQGAFAYIANTGTNNISVVNLANNTLSSTITLPANICTGCGPVALVFDPTSTKLYVGESNASLGKILIIDTLKSDATYNQVISTSSLLYSGGFLPQANALSPTGTQLFANPTYYPLSVIFNPVATTTPNTLDIVQLPSLGTSAVAPDGYGSNTFTTIVTNSGVRNVQAYIVDATHPTTQIFPNDGTVPVVQTPTIQGHNVSFTSGSGNILVNFDAQGGTFSANTSVQGYVMAGGVGTAPITVTASSAGNVFQLGAMAGLNITGAIKSPTVIVQTTANNGAISISAPVGQANIGTVNIFASGSGAVTMSGAGSLLGSTVSVASATGNLGTVLNPIQTQASNIIAQTTGSAVINNVGFLQTARETTANFSLTDNISYTVSSSWLLASPITSLSTSAGSNGSIAINTQLGSSSLVGNNVTIHADGFGSITQGFGAFNITADTISLSSGTGNIGFIGGSIRTTANSITATTAGFGSVNISNSGNLSLGNSTGGSSFNLVTGADLTIAGTLTQASTVNLQTTLGNIFLNPSSRIAATSSLTLTANGSARSINQADPSNVTTLFAPTMVLTAGSGASANIGTASFPIVIAANPAAGAQNVTLTMNAGDSIFVNGTNSVTSTPVNVNMVGSSADTKQFTLLTTGGINISPGATIKATDGTVGNITFVAGTASSITQTAPGLTLLAKTIQLTADSLGSTGSIGTSLANIGVNSGLVNTPLVLTALAGNNVFVSGMQNFAQLNNVGSLNLTGANSANFGSYNATASGNLNIATSATVSGGTAVSLATTGNAASISQSDAAGNTTIFSPTVKLSTGFGLSNIGAGNAIGIAQTSNDVSNQTVALTANAGNNVDIRAVSSGHPANLVSVNFVGSSASGFGNTSFNLQASGGILVSNTQALGGKVSAGTTLQLTAGAGGSITQLLASTFLPTLSATNVNLLADVGGSTGTIGTFAVPVGVSAGVLTATSGANLNVNDTVSVVATLNSQNGSVQIADSAGIVFKGGSNAFTTFSSNSSFSSTSLGVSGNSPLSGSITAGTSITLAASGITQVDAQTVNDLIAPAVTLTTTFGGIGSAGRALGIATQAGLVPGAVNLSVSSNGAVFINGNSLGIGGSPAGFNLTVPTNLTLGNTANINVAGDLVLQGGNTVSAPSSMTLTTTAAGTSTGSIQGNFATLMSSTFNLNAAGQITPVNIRNPFALNAPISLTANGTSGVNITSLSPVNMVAASGTGASSLFGFNLTAAGITFNPGSSITSIGGGVLGAAVNLTTTNLGSISQLGQGNIVISSPTIGLQTDNTATNNFSTIGQSFSPLTVTSGIAATPVTLNAKSFAGTYIARSSTTPGDVNLTGANTVQSTNPSSAFSLSTTGNILLNAGATISAPGTLTLTASGATGTITQTDASTTTTLFAPTMVLTAGTGGSASIGGAVNALSIASQGNAAQTVNLTLKSGGFVNLNAANSVFGAALVSTNFVGASSSGAGLSVGATGNIGLAPAATITATTSINFVAGAGSSITQSIPGIGLFAPTINLVADAAGSVGSIGTSLNPVGINSGVANTPVQLLANAGNNVFVAASQNFAQLNNVGSVNIVGTSSAGAAGKFNLSSTGNINFNVGGTITGGSVTLTATGNGSSISQTAALGTTSIFTSNLVMTAGFGLANIGAVNAIGFAQTANNVANQNVNLTVNAGNNINLSAANTNFLGNSVAVNFVGSSASGFGNTTFSLTSTGSILVSNTNALGGKVSAGTGQLSLTALTGASITQAVASSFLPSLSAGTITLNADILSNAGTIGTGPVALGISAANFNATAGSNVNILDMVAAKANVVSVSGSVQVVDNGGLTYVGNSSAATTFSSNSAFSATALGVSGSSPVSGKITAGTSISITASGITQSDAQTVNDLSSPAVTLATTFGGIGSAGHGVGINTQANAGSLVTLTASSNGNVFINGNSAGIGVSPSGFNLFVPLSQTLGNASTLTVAGDLQLNGTINSNGSVSLTTTAAGTSVGNISQLSGALNSSSFNFNSAGNTNLAIGNPFSVFSPITLTAVATGDASFTSTSPVNLNGASSAGANATTGFSLTAAGNIVFNNGASITSIAGTPGVALTTTSKGSITQMSPSAVSIVSPKISLLADISSGSFSSIGTSPFSPIIINSGINATPVTLVTQTAANTYVSAVTQNTVVGSVVLGTNNSVVSTQPFATYSLNASGSITQSAAANTTSIFAPTIILTAGAGSSVGTVAVPIAVAAAATGATPQTVSLTANAGDSVYISAVNSSVAQPVNLTIAGASAAPNNFVLTGTGSMSNQVFSAVSASTVSLQSSSATGNIGTSLSAFNTGTNNLTVNTIGTGTVFINNTKSTTLNLGASQSGGAMSVSTSGPLNVAGNLTTNASTTSNLGNLTVKNSTGALTLNANLTANGGSIQVQNTDQVNGTIVVSSGVQIATNVTSVTKGTNGQVAMFIGFVTSTQNPVPPNSAPANITVVPTGTGTAYFGQTPSAIVAPSATVTVNATNQNVFFNSPSAARTITLGSGVVITADPPAPGVLLQATTPAPSVPLLAVSPQSARADLVGSTLTSPVSSQLVSSSYLPTRAELPVQTDTALRGAVSFNSSAMKGADSSDVMGSDSSIFKASQIKLFDRTGIRAPRLNANLSSKTLRNHLQPVGFAADSKVSGGDESPFTQAAQNGVFELSRGGVLFAPSSDLTVKTPHGDVHIAADAVALVVVERFDVSVFNLHDEHYGDVALSVGAQKHPVCLAQHVMLSRRQMAYEKLNPVDWISHADMDSIDLSNGSRVFRSKFSIASALSGLQPVLSLQNSPNSQDRKISNRLMKNAAILMQTRMHSVPYRYMTESKPLMTAHN